MGSEIHGLKVKHLHVGGVLGSGEVKNGIRGCIQVRHDVMMASTVVSQTLNRYHVSSIPK